MLLPKSLNAELESTVADLISSPWKSVYLEALAREQILSREFCSSQIGHQGKPRKGNAFPP